MNQLEYQKDFILATSTHEGEDEVIINSLRN